MSTIGDAIQEKCMAFGDRIIKLNDYLLSSAVAAHENCKKTAYQKKGKQTSYIKPQTSDISVAAVPVYLQAVSALCNQLLRSGTSIGANNAEATNAVSKTDYRSKSYIALKEAREVTEQRVESQVCLSYPESRRNSTKSKFILDRTSSSKWLFER